MFFLPWIVRRIMLANTPRRAVFFLILWPMPLYGSGYIFSKKFFTGWVSVGIAWIFCSFVVVGLYPAWESRATLARVVRHMVTGTAPTEKTPTEQLPQLSSAEDLSGTGTPVSWKA